MTIQQIIFDALAWCRYLAASKSVDRTAVKVIFFEAFETIYEMAASSNPEWFTKSASYSGTSITLPADFRKELILLVNDAGVTAGFCDVVDNDTWTVRMQYPRSKGAAQSTDPIARKEQTTFVLSKAITSGTLYYIKNYAETQLSDESTDLATLMPVIFQVPLLSEMQRLIRLRHFKTSDAPTESEKRAAIIRGRAREMKRSLKPLEIVEGNSEKPQSVSTQ